MISKNKSKFPMTNKNTESKNPKLVKIKNRTIVILSKSAESNSKKPRFLEEQGARRLLTNIGI